MSKLMLVDGNALVHRAYHAIPPLNNSKGEPTNAVFGFASMLLGVLATEKPDYVVVCFDIGKTFRHEESPEYKANRPVMPEDLAVQFGRVREIVSVLGLATAQLEGYEADDVLGTLARQATTQGLQSLIVTGDTDALQLVDDQVRVLTSKGKFSDTIVYDAAAVRQRYGLEPAQLADFRGLKGDASDNIPNIPGVGEVTATKLLQQFGSVEGVFAHLDQVDPKLRDKLTPYAEQAQKSKRLATIVTNAPVKLDLAAGSLGEMGKMGKYDRQQAVALFRELEFRSLVDKLPAVEIRGSGDQGIRESGLKQAGIPQQMALFGEATPSAVLRPPSPILHHLVDTPAKLEQLAARLSASQGFVMDTETTGTDALKAELVGLVIAVDGDEGYYIPAEMLNLSAIQNLKSQIANPSIPKFAHNAKYDLTILAEHGFAVQNLSFDTMIAAYLLNEKALGLKDLAFTRLQMEMTPISDLIGKGKSQISMAQVPVEQAAPYACADAAVTYRLMRLFEPELQAQGLWPLFTEVEMPLVPVLVQMERDGVALDTDALKAMSRDLFQRIGGLEEQIYQAVGHRFNINSTQQLAGVLFEELKLDKSRRTKTGYSTDSGVLEELKGKHPVVDLILEHRQLVKLKSTYVDALPLLVDARDGRVHTDFNQAVTSTGRLSSSNPNLQNIPIRTEVGQQVRKAFVAAPGCLLLAADYSQVELRILAHISQDQNLIATFARGEDIHTATAAFIFGIKPEEVTSAQRRVAKGINFGIVYGMGDYGLAQRTELDQKDASRYIADYFARHPGVKNYLDDTKRQARQQGYVSTLLGRRRYMPEFRSPNHQVVAAAERMAINMPIQGCLPYTTRVITSAGVRSVGDLYHTDCASLRIWTGTTFASFQVLSRGPCELAELVLENGHVLCCDTRHEVLVVTEDGYAFKHYRDLVSGDRICLSMPQEIEFGSPPIINYQYVPRAHNGRKLSITSLDESFFYWLGFYYGDGFLASDPARWNLSFSIGARPGRFTIEEKTTECVRYFQSLGLGAQVRRQSPRKAAVTVYSKGLITLLERIGISRGIKAATKRLPAIVFSSPLAMRKVFLQGIMDSDGYAGSRGATNPSIHLCQKPLLDDLWLLFRTVGVECKIRGPYKYGGNQSYRLDLVGGMLESSIGFSGRQILKIPYMAAPAFLTAAFLDAVVPQQLASRSHKVIYSRLRQGGTTSIYTLAEMVKATRSSFPIPIYAWSRLKEKRNLGFEEETFTVAVDDPGHRFDSEGIISKNTAADVIKVSMVRLAEAIEKRGLRSRMILQVHDELIFEVPNDELATMKPLVKEIMEKSTQMSVELKVDLKVGKNWGDMEE